MDEIGSGQDTINGVSLKGKGEVEYVLRPCECGERIREMI